MQRIDQDETRRPARPDNVGEVREVGEVADPPGPRGPHGVELGRQPPVAAFRRAAPVVRSRRGVTTSGHCGRGAVGVRHQGVPAEAEVRRDGERRAAGEDAVDVDRLVPVLPLGGLVPAAVLGVDPDADVASVRHMDVDGDFLPLPARQRPAAGCAATAPAGDSSRERCMFVRPVGRDAQGRRGRRAGCLPDTERSTPSQPAERCPDAVGCREFAQEQRLPVGVRRGAAVFVVRCGPPCAHSRRCPARAPPWMWDSPTSPRSFAQPARLGAVAALALHPMVDVERFRILLQPGARAEACPPARPPRGTSPR